MSLLSIIIPAYNEGALIQNTASVVADIMEKHSIDYEIVFVNDGSKDATWDEIQKAHRNNAEYVSQRTLEKKAQYLPVWNMRKENAVSLWTVICSIDRRRS